MVVDPAAVNHCYAVQVRDVVGREEGREDIAYKAADAVHGENVEGVVDAEDEFEFSAVVGEGSAQDTEGDGSPCGDVS